MSVPRIVFAGNRWIGVSALEMLLQANIQPVLLLLAESDSEDDAAKLRALIPHIPFLQGKNALKTPEGVQAMIDAKPDYILSVHYPYIIPQNVIDIAKKGTLNLHPAYLPFNRGWHTPSWAIYEGTPYGATFHFVDAGLDTGDIIAQRQVEVLPSDTAHTLLQRAMACELDIFRETLPLLMSDQLPRTPQQGEGTAHKKADLAALQKLDLAASKPVGEVIDALRALTTNKPEEAAYFEEDGKKYRVRVEIIPE